MNEFATKKCVKLGKLLKEGGGLDLTKKTKKHRKKKLDQETGRVNPNSDPVPNQDCASDAVSACYCLILLPRPHFNFIFNI